MIWMLLSMLLASGEAHAACRVVLGPSDQEVAFRLDGEKTYQGRSGFDVAGRGEGCSLRELALGVVAL